MLSFGSRPKRAFAYFMERSSEISASSPVICVRF